MSTTTQANALRDLPPMKIRRKYQCKLCNLSTQNPRLHLKHRIDAHNHKIKCVECPFCEYACQYRQKLNRHLRLVHKMTPALAKSYANSATGFTNNAVSPTPTMQQVEHQTQIERYQHQPQQQQHAQEQAQQQPQHPQQTIAVNNEDNQLQLQQQLQQQQQTNLSDDDHQRQQSSGNIAPIWDYQQSMVAQQLLYNQYQYYDQQPAQSQFYFQDSYFYQQQCQQQQSNHQQYYHLQQQQNMQQYLQFLIQTMIIGSTVGRSRCLAAPSSFFPPPPADDNFVAPTYGPNEPVDLTLASNGRANSKETT